MDYNIGCVQDVYSLGQKVWIVNLQQENLVVVRVADRHIDELDNKEINPVVKTKKGTIKSQ
ncbi:MAG: hypothetical protein ICV79_25580 [Flavisolibacter sp.]|nr:hypothetical protein [Flavisolibacter sp.]